MLTSSLIETAMTAVGRHGRQRTRIIRFPSFAAASVATCYCSSTSSAAAAPAAMEVFSEADTDADAVRPRLQALRERLAIEETNGVASVQTTRATLKSSGLVNQGSNCSTHSSSSTLSTLSTSTTSPKQQQQKPLVKTTSTTTSTTTSPSFINSSSGLPASLEELILRLRDMPLPNMSPNSFLQDRFHRSHSYLRISLVERCNLRCTYCMPPDGLPDLQPTSSLLQTPELLHLASLFTDMGVRKIRLTGGEPLLRKDLVDVLYGLTHTLSHPLEQLGMTTNGVTLARQLPTLVQAGLTHVNLSLDTLQNNKFERITRRKGFDKVWQSLETACDMYQPERDDRDHEPQQHQQHHQQAQSQEGGDTQSPTTTTTTNNTSNTTARRPPGLGRIKLNCVVMRGVNDDELADFCQLTLRYPMLDVRFIEWMPFMDNGWETNHLVPYQEMKQRLTQQQDTAAATRTRTATTTKQQRYTLQRLVDGPHDTTKWYQWVEQEEVEVNNDHDRRNGTSMPVGGRRLPDRGRIGFISSMTDHFCATCNRLRLTADGQFKVCLFGSHEVSLRDALRHGVPTEDLQRIIAHAVWNKHWALGGHDSALQLQEHAHDNRPMVLIGG